jgi:hypothetical protein
MRRTASSALAVKVSKASAAAVAHNEILGDISHLIPLLGTVWAVVTILQISDGGGAVLIEPAFSAALLNADVTIRAHCSY